MITEVRSKDGKKVYALRLKVSSAKEGTFPASRKSWPLQALLMARPRGHVVRTHVHKKIPKSSSQPMEALVVVRGALEARIFDRKGIFISKTRVASGECLFILDGAHEITFTKDSLAYEFKTGPYKEDKTFL